MNGLSHSWSYLIPQSGVASYYCNCSSIAAIICPCNGARNGGATDLAPLQSKAAPYTCYCSSILSLQHPVYSTRESIYICSVGKANDKCTGHCLFTYLFNSCTMDSWTPQKMASPFWLYYPSDIMQACRHISKLFPPSIIWPPQPEHNFAMCFWCILLVALRTQFPWSDQAL